VIVGGGGLGRSVTRAGMGSVAYTRNATPTPPSNMKTEKMPATTIAA
ncbi:hypothetical protein HR086_40110, partial [Myxococcus sp. CA039A]|nr:hypothetical protein [Myxococcus sp. CA039A]